MPTSLHFGMVCFRAGPTVHEFTCACQTYPSISGVGSPTFRLIGASHGCAYVRQAKGKGGLCTFGSSHIRMCGSADGACPPPPFRAHWCHQPGIRVGAHLRCKTQCVERLVQMDRRQIRNLFVWLFAAGLFVCFVAAVRCVLACRPVASTGSTRTGREYAEREAMWQTSVRYHERLAVTAERVLQQVAAGGIALPVLP